MNRARAGVCEFSLIFDFFQIEDVPAHAINNQSTASYRSRIINHEAKKMNFFIKNAYQ